MIHGGSALIGDYGHWGEKEDTFRVDRRFSLLKRYKNTFFIGIL